MSQIYIPIYEVVYGFHLRSYFDVAVSNRLARQIDNAVCIHHLYNPPRFFFKSLRDDLKGKK